MKKQNSFIKASAILAFSSIMVKVISAVYRIPLTRMLGPDIMGRYSAVFNMFMPFFSFATVGISASVSGHTAKEKCCEGVVSVRRAAYLLYILSGLSLSFAFLFFSKFYADLRHNDMFFTGSVILAPAIILSVIENIFKGESQGRMDMLPTARANVIESLCKAVIGLSGVWYIKKFCFSGKNEKSLVVCFAAVTISGVFSTAFLFLNREKQKIGKQKALQTKEKVKSLFKMSFPMALSALVISSANFFDTAVCVPKIADLPYSEITNSFIGASFKGAADMSMHLFGIWQGMALTIFNLVPAAVASAGTAGLPVLSKLCGENNTEKLNKSAQKLFNITAFAAFPATAFIFCFAQDIIKLIFDTSFSGAVVASVLLKIVITGCIFACFNSVFNSIMYSVGKSDKVFFILLIGTSAKILISWLLCGISWINIRAFAVSTVCFHTIIFLMSISAVKKAGVRFDFFKISASPLTSSVVSVFIVKLINNVWLCGLPLILQLFFSGVIFSLLYFLIILFLGFSVDK